MTKTVVAASTVAGIKLTSITTNTTPAVSCSGPSGAVVCTSTGQGNSSGNVLTAKLTLIDASGAVITNTTGSPITIDLVRTGDGSVSPSGASVLSIAAGASETSASFTLDRANGNNKTVVLTATIHGTTQTLTVTLSS